MIARLRKWCANYGENILKLSSKSGEVDGGHFELRGDMVYARIKVKNAWREKVTRKGASPVALVASVLIAELKREKAKAA